MTLPMLMEGGPSSLREMRKGSVASLVPPRLGREKNLMALKEWSRYVHLSFNRRHVQISTMTKIRIYGKLPKYLRELKAKVGYNNYINRSWLL